MGLGLGLLEVDDLGFLVEEWASSGSVAPAGTKSERGMLAT